MKRFWASFGDRRAFSVIELMVVVGVVGVLAIMIAPTTRSFLRSRRVDGAANVMLADIHYAHSLARSERRTYRLAVGATEYRIEKISPPDTVRTRELPQGLACSAPDTLTFFAWGLTTPGSITISSDGPTATVQLSANGSASYD